MPAEAPTVLGLVLNQVEREKIRAATPLDKLPKIYVSKSVLLSPPILNSNTFELPGPPLFKLAVAILRDFVYPPLTHRSDT